MEECVIYILFRIALVFIAPPLKIEHYQVYSWTGLLVEANEVNHQEGLAKNRKGGLGVLLSIKKVFKLCEYWTKTIEFS